MHRLRLLRAEWHVYVEMMGLIGADNTPMVGMAVAVAVEKAMNKDTSF